MSLFRAGRLPTCPLQQVLTLNRWQLTPQLTPNPPRVESVAPSLQSSSLQNTKSDPENTSVTIKTLPTSLTHRWLLAPYLLWVLAFSRMCEAQLHLSSGVDILRTEGAELIISNKKQGPQVSRSRALQKLPPNSSNFLALCFALRLSLNIQIPGCRAEAARGIPGLQQGS